MSTEIERVFHGAKLLIRPERNALSAESIKCYKLLHNWLKGHTIPKQVDDGEVSDDEV